VYCTDKPLAAYLRSRLRAAPEIVAAEVPQTVSHAVVSAPSNVVPLRRVSPDERAAGVAAAPVIDLGFAASAFRNAQALEGSWSESVALPDWIRPQPGLFVAQVVSDSMNRRIPSGSWCLFRVQPSATPEGKAVVVQHPTVTDHEAGGYITRLYASEKAPAEYGGWSQQRLTLRPGSDQPGFEPIVIQLGVDEAGLPVVAEMLMVLGPSDR
jgi:uncharacterized protein